MGHTGTGSKKHRQITAKLLIRFPIWCDGVSPDTDAAAVADDDVDDVHTL